MRKSIALAWFISSLLLNTRAGTFNVTLAPNIVSNNYTGLITFQMSGLSPGESVQIVQFYDLNGNGVVDGLDLGVRGELVTDGQAALVGGATNINVLRDEDGAANGAISGSIRFALAPEFARGVGTYIFRFSSPVNHFPVSTLPLTVVSAPYGQKIQGVVKSNGTNVPYAGVALIQIVNGRTKTIVGSAADATGNYTLKALPDAYDVIAFWPGYVGDFNAAPHVTLAANATITTNLNLIPATTTLSGTLVDNDHPGSPALPYAQITAFTTSHLFTLWATDSNANFNLPVTPGMWTVRTRWQSAVAKSYLVAEPGSFLESSFDTSAGPVSGSAVPLKRATALIYGTVEDNHSNSIPGITLSASADGGAFDAFGTSDSNGSYALAIDAGGGFVNVQDLSSPPANDFLWSGNFFNTADGQALNLNVTGIVATASFRGQILDDSGAPVSQFSFFANNDIGGTSLATTDTNGFFNLPVFGGHWQLYPDFGEAEQRSLILPPYTFKITDGVDLTSNIIARKATGRISGNVRDQSSGGISGLAVSFGTTVGATSYNLNAYTDSNGDYSLAVFNGTWKVSLGPYDLFARGDNPANPIAVTVPPADGIANFNLIPIGPPSDSPRITTTSLPDAFAGQDYFQTLLVTNAVQSFSWSISSGALPDGLRLDSFFGSISGMPTSPGLAKFTVQLRDSRDIHVTNALSINVRAAPPQAPKLDNPALLPDNVFNVRVTGVAGERVTLQVATAVTNWTDILTTNAPSNVFYLQDAYATNSARMYRLQVNP